jgi:hypothetical protein
MAVNIDGAQICNPEATAMQVQDSDRSQEVFL